MKNPLLTMIAVLALSTTALTGCESVTKVTGAIGNTFSTLSGRGIITKEKSDFDGKMAVRMTPDDLVATNKNNGRQYMLGALWNESFPNEVVLIVNTDAGRSRGTSKIGLSGLLGDKTLTFQAIDRMDTNIDGRTGSFNAVSESSLTRYNFSKDVDGSFFVVPVQSLENLLSGKDSKVRFKGGITEDNFQFSSAQSITGTRTAIIGLRTFLDAVYEIKKGDRSVGNRVAGETKNSVVGAAVSGSGSQEATIQAVTETEKPTKPEEQTTTKPSPTKKKKKK